MKKNRGLSFNDQGKKEINMPLVRAIAIWAIEIFAVVLMAYAFVTYVGSKTTVVGQSMAETLEDGDNILVNKLSYLVLDPKPNDVIVFLPNGNEKSHYYVKRVIAVPGDTVQIKNGTVYVNGEQFAERIESEKIEEPELAKDEIVLAKDEYFVLGDNRNNSEDSRYSNIGNVKKEYIVGKAWFVASPFSKLGFLK